MANINKIKLSGTSYDIQDSNAARSVTLTQAQYDALQTKDPNVFYIISDSSISYMTSGDTESAITQAVSGKADTSAVTSVSDSLTAHTANTTVHVTAQDKTNWNAKSDFSGSYNDLTDKPTIPTVPTSNTAFTNDAGYITEDAISGKVDTTTYTAYTAATDTALSGKQDTLSAGTNITISGNVISAEGGGKAISAGTNISVTTGATADTINCTIPAFFHSNTNKGDIDIGSNNGVSSDYGRLVIGRRVQSRGNPYFQYSIGIGVQPDNSNNYCQLYGQNSVGIGRGFKIGSDSLYANGINNAVAIGHNATSRNNGDVTLGADTTASGGSSVAIGSGATANGAEYKMNLNNQIKVTPSNQVYIYNKDNTEMICLQDQLGGGGSSYSAGDGIDITNDVISVTGKVDTSAFTAHTADTTIHVTSAEKATWNAKSDFSGSYNDLTNKPTIPTSASQLTNDTGYITSSALDSYATTATTSALNNTLTAHTADTTIHVTSADKSSWNGAATNASNAVTALGGLSLVKLTQAEYDALATKDSNTLYVING